MPESGDTHIVPPFTQAAKFVPVLSDTIPVQSAVGAVVIAQLVPEFVDLHIPPLFTEATIIVPVLLFDAILLCKMKEVLDKIRYRSYQMHFQSAFIVTITF